MNNITTRQKRIVLWIILILVGLLILAREYQTGATNLSAPRTRTPTSTKTATGAVTPTVTPVPPTVTGTVTQTVTTAPPTPTNGASQTPYPGAPLCADSGANHDNTKFHTLWDSARGCHYNHEHGQDPFIPSVANTFPGFDLFALLGGVQIGHTNPSSPLENTDKHGGFKWDVTLSPVVKGATCTGREGSATGVDKLVVQYHGFGVYAIEMEAELHSAAGFMRQCRVGNPTDYGYVFVVQHENYGQRLAAYQGDILPYTFAAGCGNGNACQPNPIPTYESPREPYFSSDCFGGPPENKCARNPTRNSIVNGQHDANTTWTAEPVNAPSSELFNLLFRGRDIFQALDRNDFTYPFTFAWLCSNNNGATFAQAPGCRYNNSTTRVHSVGGFIPPAWDNLGGFDTNPAVGRITTAGVFYVNAFGTELMPTGFCMTQAVECFPIKLVNAFTGEYGVNFDISSNPLNFSLDNLPERDIYFCGQTVCAEGASGATASGWIGPAN